MRCEIRHRETCRACGSRNLTQFVCLDDMPFTDEFVAPANAGSEFLAPLRVYVCSDCLTAQTLHDVEVADYYRDYHYTVSASPFAQAFMDRLAANTFEKFGFGAGDSVVEVGSGDGYQLKCFQKLGARVMGFEPSDQLTRDSRDAGVPTAQCLFEASTVDQIPADMRPVQVVLLTYTFDHLPDPLPFLHAVKSALDPERGILLLEVHDLAKIIERRETCLFAHEHSIYLTVLSMQRLLERAGFKLISGDIVPERQRRGNSLLIAASPKESPREPWNDWDSQAAKQYDDMAVYQTFQENVDRGYRHFAEHVRSLGAEGRRAAGYGAGGRGVMTLGAAQLGNGDLSYICDQNPSFHGLLAPKSHVPVVAPSRLIDDPVDEVIVFSFGYMDEILRTLAPHVERGGTVVSMLDLLI